jgi:hypothetical protein
MRRIPFFFAATAACVLGTATPARAQTEPDAPEEGTPPARKGFQLALRSGYMVPFGQASGAPGDTMGNTFSGQVPLLVDIGGKLSPNVFLGGYLGLGFGGTAGETSNVCSRDNVTCVTASLRLGIEAQYQFTPDASTNPWIGYGIGIESTAFSGSNGGTTYSVAAAGWEFGHFMAGLDFRLSKTIGIGPMVDFSLAEYNTISVNENGQTSNGTVANKALHEWLLVGPRLVFFP